MTNKLNDSEVLTALNGSTANYNEFALWYANHIEPSSGLSLRQRVLMSIACDVCEQTLNGPLEFHIRIALENGATRQDVKEAILHMSVYGAFPKCFETIDTLHQIYAKFDEEGLYLTGDTVTYPEPDFNWILDTDIKSGLIEFDAQYGDLTSRMAGEIWGRAGLDVPFERAFISIAGDVSQQTLSPEGPFTIHVRDLCLKNGKTREQLRQIISYLTIDIGIEKVWRALEAFDAIP